MWAMIKNIPFFKSRPLVSVVRLSGVIATGDGGGRLNDAGLAPMLERAFRKGKPAAVALIVNSPGGSPVQSSLIAARIRRLSSETKTPVHCFVEDVAASGGYWLATAADQIWVDDSSIVGSIGVISAGFGFPELLSRHGIERRVYTAGKSKSMLDPFKPENPDDIVRLKALQEQIHESFVAQVTARRGTKLADQELFTGDIWVGKRAVEVGLADGVAHLVPHMKALFGDKTRFAVYGQRRRFLSRFGISLLGDALVGLEERALWARFGL
jgi:signal peptide peptidase SppA